MEMAGAAGAIATAQRKQLVMTVGADVLHETHPVGATEGVRLAIARSDDELGHAVCAEASQAATPALPVTLRRGAAGANKIGTLPMPDTNPGHQRLGRAASSV